MITLGVDLSADPRKTGVAQLEWGSAGATVVALDVGKHGDKELVALTLLADKTGIDCPFGWPDRFIDYVVAHRQGSIPLPTWPTRVPLSYRETDLFVKQTTGVQGLSVSADRIGSTAMRCAVLLAMLEAQGAPVDRTGRGNVVEVYPAAALAAWGFDSKGYKRPENVVKRDQLIDSLLSRANWLDLGQYEPLCRLSDDALDAVLCALIAGFALADQCAPIPPQLLETARREGWIALPTVSPEEFEELLGHGIG